jgi:tetrahydromethanopterin S-methyltransferase subunit F
MWNWIERNGKLTFGVLLLVLIGLIAAMMLGYDLSWVPDIFSGLLGL